MPDEFEVDPAIVAGVEDIEPESITIDNETGKPDPTVPAPDTLMLVNVLSGICAGIWGDEIGLKPDEAENLTLALDPVLDKYLPNMAIGCEVTLLITAAMIVMPRYTIYQSMKAASNGEESKPDEKEPAHSVSGGDGVRKNDGA